MDVNGLAFIGIVVLLLGWFIYEILRALNGGIWRCAACDFRTRSEEEALGHQVLHAQHKPIRES